MSSGIPDLPIPASRDGGRGSVLSVRRDLKEGRRRWGRCGAGQDQRVSHVGVRRRERSGAAMSGLVMVLLLVVVALLATALTMYA